VKIVVHTSFGASRICLVDEFDQESAQWTLLSQITDRVQPLLDHPVTNLRNVRMYLTDKHDILSALSANLVQAEGICLHVE
jgi:hypothetical protein